MGNTTLQGQLQPLSIPLLDSKLGGKLPGKAEEEGFSLNFAKSIVGKSEGSIKEMFERYKQVSCIKHEPFFTPNHEKFMQTIMKPLIEAKWSYIVNMPVSCIAMSGLVGEMVAVWRFEMLKPKMGGKDLDPSIQKLLFGKKFEKLDQWKRVEVLQAFGDIDEELKDIFTTLRKIRNQYLHFAFIDNKKLDNDACSAYRCGCELVTKTLSIKPQNGVLILPDKVMSYFKG